MRVHDTGGPDSMRWESVDIAAPGPGEVHIRHTAIGLNYIDVYFRTGLYPAPAMPLTPGMEGAGEVVGVGAGVADLVVGDRVAYAGGPPGAYSEERLIDATKLVKIPASVTDQQAAAMMLQGMTTEYLLCRTYPVKAGDTILIHAAAGGVGLIACQWAKHLGVTVIGTVGSKAKAALARAHGCDHTILYKEENVAERVKDITGGTGVPVVYDSVAKDTIEGSLASLQPRGMLVLFGQSSGPVPPFELSRLSTGGSLYVTRPTLMTYTATRADLVASANAVFEVVASGAVKIEVHQTFALSEAAAAHRALEARETTGSTLLLP